MLAIAMQKMKIMKIIINQKEGKRTKIIIKEFNSFWEFQVKTKSKLYKLKEAIFTGKSKNENVNDHAIFENSLLQNRISSLTSEFSKKDGIMEFYKKHKCNTNNKWFSSNSAVWEFSL